MNNILKKKKVNPNDDDRVSSMVENPSVGDRFADVVVIILCGLVAFCSLVPMWHVLMASLSDGKVLLSHNGVAWLPQGGVTLDGFKHIFKDNSILTGYANSLIYTAASTALGFFIACTAGYAMSRETKLKNVMILSMMVTMLFSGGMVPTYMVIRKLGWVGSRLSLIVPGCTNAMFMIMMMNAFNSVPKEMYEAARIDGAGHFRTMSQIMLPQAMNLGFVIILNSVVMHWNAWLQASIYVPNNKKLWPLQLWIKQIVADNQNFLQNANPDYNRYLIQYAVIVAATLPILALFPFFQDKLEKGVIAGGVKG